MERITRKSVQVFFSDSSYNYCTSVNPESSSADLRVHFVGTVFNMGSGDGPDDMQKCIGISIIEDVRICDIASKQQIKPQCTRKD